MNRQLIFTVKLVVLFTYGICLSWGALVNPTQSDNGGNTAGGTGVLERNYPVHGYGASHNTGFGYYALTSNRDGWNNTAVGYSTLFSNFQGIHNTAIGASALTSNSDGSANTAIGAGALYHNTTGYGNTASSETALFRNTTGSNNTANGLSALNSNTTGNNNTASGVKALYSNKTGYYNTASGLNSLYNNITGVGNTGFGVQSLYHQTTGFYNLAMGLNAGFNLKTGSYNIYIGNVGAVAESLTIRIGSKQTRSFIAGVRGKNIGMVNAVPVFIDSNGQLGTIFSSARFKKDIQDMNEASRNLLKLRPVTYRYKQADDSGANPLDYGLIAEEVAKVYPDLVAYSADGKIETVQYQKLTPMLLNELQHLNVILQTESNKGENLESQLKAEQLKNQQMTKEVAELKAQIFKVAGLEQQVASLQTQARTIQVLTARLSRIEAGQMVGLNRERKH